MLKKLRFQVFDDLRIHFGAKASFHELSAEPEDAAVEPEVAGVGEGEPNAACLKAALNAACWTNGISR